MGLVINPHNGGIPQTENKVGVSVHKKDGKFFIRVQVWGKYRPKSSAHKFVRIQGTRNLEHVVMLAAGACAEYLCERLKDDVDPRACAHAARRGLRKLKAGGQVAATGIA